MPSASLTRLCGLDPLAGSPQTERGARRLPSALAWAAALALVAMGAFHLWTGTAGAFTAVIQRSSHLTFALGLAFLLFPGRWAEMLASITRGVVRATCFLVRPLPCHARPEPWLGRIDASLAAWGRLRHRPPWRWLIVGLEAALLLAAVACALYPTLYYEQLAGRAATGYLTADLVVAGLAVALILEATRRSISPPLAAITLAFLLYAFFGHLLPGQWGHAPLSLHRLLTQQYYTLDAIFGVPLAVSSTFVFLFVLFGAALDRSGAGRYLIDLAFATMGRFRGGPAKAAVLASGFMGTLSGSSIANTVTTGSMTIPLMKKVGFSRPVAGAVEVAASTNGQLMPPVMGAAAFIMAERTNIPYSTIIVAALLPALLSYTVIFTMVHLEALRSGIRANTTDEVPPLRRTLLRGLHLNIPFIALIVLLLGLPTALTEPFGLELQRRTPSTAATFAIWITLGVFLVVTCIAPLTAYGLHRLMEARAAQDAQTPEAAQAQHPTPASGERASPETGIQSPRTPAAGLVARLGHFATQTVAALRDGAMNMIGIACACACCGIIIGVVAQTGMGFKITNLIQTISGGALLPALLLTALASILLGIGLPTTATYIIMATLTAPAILAIAAPDQIEPAVSLVLATHLFVFYYGILADDTPPVGLCAYAAAGIAGADPIRTGLNSFRLDLAAFLLPLMFFYNHELLLQDVTWLEVMWVLPTAVVGMICFAMGLQGYALGPLGWWQRGLLIGAAFLLVMPALWATGLGVAAAIVAVGTGWLSTRHRAAADEPT